MTTLVQRLNDVISAIGLDIKSLFARSLPTGGTTGQVLTKVDSTDFNASWQTPSVSGGGSSNVFIQDTEPVSATPFIWYKTDSTTGEVLDILKGPTP